MNLTGTIYTTKKKKLVESALPLIKERVELAKGVTLGEIEIVEITLPKDAKTKQKGVANRIDFDWMNETYKTDGNILCLHIGKKERDALKLRHPNGGNLGGSYNRNIGDSAIDFFIIADTKADVVKKFTHELGHGLSHWLGVADMTHVFDYTLHNLDALYQRFDATDWDKKNTLVGLLIKLRDLLLKQKASTLHPRLPKQYNKASQGYGVPNPIYKLTGRHIGIDYACPVGTPVYAPWDGEVIVSGNHSDLGNFCYFRYIFDGKTRVERFLHLNAIPRQGKYKRGATVAFSGSSGLSTGPHLHVDGWWNEVSTGTINKDNWDKLTYNPQI